MKNKKMIGSRFETISFLESNVSQMLFDIIHLQDERYEIIMMVDVDSLNSKSFLNFWMGK